MDVRIDAAVVSYYGMHRFIRWVTGKQKKNSCVIVKCNNYTAVVDGKHGVHCSSEVVYGDDAPTRKKSTAEQVAGWKFLNDVTGQRT